MAPPAGRRQPPWAILVRAQSAEAHPTRRESTAGWDEVFARDLRRNLGLLRKRLRSTELLALSVPFAPQRAGAMALVYLDGKADPRVVRAVRIWASTHAGEEVAGRGVMNPVWAVLGLLPRFGRTAWADKAAMMLDAGFVILLIDRVEYAYMAPVTLANWMTSASDTRFPLPHRRWLLQLRTGLQLLVLLLPGSVIALQNYHQEMIPTAFLLSLGAARESAPFATIFELILLEGLTEISREVAFRLPQAVPIGLVSIVYVLIVLVGVQGGFLGPLPALTAVLGSLVSLALPTYGITYLIRIWRFLLILGATMLGFFGMATMTTLLATYLCQAKSWGVPFLGPSGANLTAPEAISSRRPKGVSRRG